EGTNKDETIQGEIERIGVVVKEGTSIYDIKLKGQDQKIFSVSTETSRDVALSKVGDMVKIKYINVGDSKYIMVDGFENIK
ncbi:MAG TPA: cell shape-determining protein, partial [Clostridium sp.]